MVRRNGLLVFLVVPLSVVGLAWFEPVVRQASAQERGARDRDDDDDDDDRPRGERDRRGPRGRGMYGGGFGRGEGRNSRRERLERSDNDGERPLGDRGSEGSSSGGARPDASGWARSLVRERDKDGDMMLKGDEQKGLRGAQAAADSNGDGAITVNEIVASMAPKSSPAPAESRSGGAKDDRGEEKSSGSEKLGGVKTRVYTALVARGDGKGSAEKRRTYRFTPATERLPASGLPSFFKSRDANRDGQVAMSEYSRSWTTRMVDEFRRYDRNGDGIITAGEAAGK